MPGPSHSPTASFGLLALRVVTGAMLIYGHGWGKLVNFQTRSATFGDPMNIGSDRSLMVAVFAEVICAALVAIGFATRFAAAVLFLLFVVIVFVHHGADPFARRELAMTYGVIYLALMLTGPGAYAVDARFGPKVRFGGGR